MIASLVAGRASDSEREWRAHLAAMAALQQRVAALEGRLAALDAHEPKALHRRNAARIADGAHLREAIRQVLAAHPGPGELTGKVVLRALEAMDTGREALPSLRTVRWHMAAIRGNGKSDALPSE